MATSLSIGSYGGGIMPIGGFLRKASARLSRNHHDLVDSELHKASTAMVKLCKERATASLWRTPRGLGTTSKLGWRGLTPIAKELRRRLNKWCLGSFIGPAKV